MVSYAITLARAAGIVLVVLTFGLACAPIVQELIVHVFGGATMGTTYTVRVVTTLTWAQDERDRIADRIQVTLDRVESKMSHYDPSSELSAFNQTRHTEWFEVSPEMFTVVSSAQALSELTGGALDVTVAPLVNAWGFGPIEPAQLPPDAARLSRLRNPVGYTTLELDPERQAVRKADPALQCDLSAVAKGYVAGHAAGVTFSLEGLEGHRPDARVVIDESGGFLGGSSGQEALVAATVVGERVVHGADEVIFVGALGVHGQ